jgi:hypothetical protein
MISDENLEEFVCAFSSNKHFLKNPLKLPNCNHSVCKQCADEKIIDRSCNICNVLVERKNIKENKDLKKSIEKNFKTLMEIIEKQMREQTIKLKSANIFNYSY